MAILIGILVGSVAAILFPGGVLWLKGALQPAFAVTMFFVGTLVRRREIEEFLGAPHRAAVGLAAQYTIMPLCAFGVSMLFRDPLLRAGIVLVGCMPGAMASNVMTSLVKGDLILSVIMTTLATAACPVVIAFWMPLLADTRITVPVAAMVWNAVWMVALPVIAGIVLRQSVRAMPRVWDRVATLTASVAIVLIILVVVAANRSRLIELGPRLAGAMIALNLSAYLIAFLVARAMRWPPKQRRTLVIEVGMQNAGLGSVLALQHLGEIGAAPSAFYTALCVVTASFALVMPRAMAKRNEASAPETGVDSCT